MRGPVKVTRTRPVANARKFASANWLKAREKTKLADQQTKI